MNINNINKYEFKLTYSCLIGQVLVHCTVAVVVVVVLVVVVLVVIVSHTHKL